MEPSRLFESPYPDYGRVDEIFGDHVVTIAETLHDFTGRAFPSDVA